MKPVHARPFLFVLALLCIGSIARAAPFGDPMRVSVTVPIDPTMRPWKLWTSAKTSEVRGAMQALLVDEATRRFAHWRFVTDPGAKTVLLCSLRDANNQVELRVELGGHPESSWFSVPFPPGTDVPAPADAQAVILESLRTAIVEAHASEIKHALQTAVPIALSAQWVRSNAQAVPWIAPGVPWETHHGLCKSLFRVDCLRLAADGTTKTRVYILAEGTGASCEIADTPGAAAYRALQLLPTKIGLTERTIQDPFPAGDDEIKSITPSVVFLHEETDCHSDWLVP